MRIVIVSNRLPVSIEKDKKNKKKFIKSSGGLSTSIGSYTEKMTDLSYIWVGWPGASVQDSTEQEEITKSLSQLNCYPVFLSEKEMDKFYLGFCNRTIWPLFHYFPTITVFENDQYEAYKTVNAKFAKTLSNIIDPQEDIVWIHDYHLMLLPNFLRQTFKNLPIGFFLHIPFPAYEVFQLLPSKWRKEILEGLLGADLIGFHTFEYVDNFSRSCLRFTGYENNMGTININERITKVGAYPIGIDFLKFNNAHKTQKIQQLMNETTKTFNNKKILFSVDRLDYTKGIPNRLLGFERFLETNKEWHGKITLFIVVVPSRIGVYHYQQMKRNIDETIGRINGKFSTVNWTPIVYQYTSLSFDELSAFYNASDIMLVTPLRDGMNLVAKEYVASRFSKDGVLILSEMTGSAKELLEAIIINPNSVEEIAQAIEAAIKMPTEEQNIRMGAMQDRINRYNVFRWVSDFIKDLNKVILIQKRMESLSINEEIENKIITKFQKSSKSLILLDYDGTLIEFSDNPRNAKPSVELLNIIELLAKNNDVTLVSGRDKDTLSDWFGQLNIHLIAEHGAFYKFTGKSWQIYQNIDTSWKRSVINILEIYMDRLPGSFIEEKRYALVFHYRNTYTDSANTLIPELNGYLQQFITNTNLRVYNGKEILEIKPASIGKHIVAEIFDLNKYDFILALGDDYTDEDMFKVLPQNAISIKVGEVSTFANYNIRNQLMVRNFLKKLT